MVTNISLFLVLIAAVVYTAMLRVRSVSLSHAKLISLNVIFGVLCVFPAALLKLGIIETDVVRGALSILYFVSFVVCMVVLNSAHDHRDQRGRR